MSDRTVKKIISEKSYSLLLVKGIDSVHNDFAVYLLIKNSFIEKFEKDYLSNKIDLDDYGKVIFGISGQEINKEIEQTVLDLFEKDYLKK